jgi:hypothetical protein
MGLSSLGVSPVVAPDIAAVARLAYIPVARSELCPKTLVTWSIKVVRGLCWSDLVQDTDKGICRRNRN